MQITFRHMSSLWKTYRKEKGKKNKNENKVW